jgi:hypothetical protein
VEINITVSLSLQNIFAWKLGMVMEDQSLPVAPSLKRNKGMIKL